MGWGLGAACDVCTSEHSCHSAAIVAFSALRLLRHRDLCPLFPCPVAAAWQANAEKVLRLLGNGMGPGKTISDAIYSVGGPIMSGGFREASSGGYLYYADVSSVGGCGCGCGRGRVCGRVGVGVSVGGWWWGEARGTNPGIDNAAACCLLQRLSRSFRCPVHAARACAPGRHRGCQRHGVAGDAAACRTRPPPPLPPPPLPAGLADVQSNGLNISRRSLQNILASALPPGALTFDKPFKAFTAPPEGQPGRVQVWGGACLPRAGRAHVADTPGRSSPMSCLACLGACQGGVLLPVLGCILGRHQWRQRLQRLAALAACACAIAG